MGAKDQIYRFCVGREGAARSAVYRFWARATASGRSDVYLAMRGMGEEFKLSVHDDRCHIAISKQAAKEIALEDRFLQTWARQLEIVDGAERAFRLVLPTSELHTERPLGDDTEGVEWIAPAGRGATVDIGVMMGTAPPDATSAFRLASGKDTWLRIRRIRIVGTEFWAGVEAQKRDMLTREPSWRLGEFAIAGESTRASVGFQPKGGPVGLVEVNLRAAGGLAGL